MLENTADPVQQPLFKMLVGLRIWVNSIVSSLCINTILSYMYSFVCVFPLHVYICSMSVPKTHKEQKRSWDQMKLELQAVVSTEDNSSFS